MASADNLNVDFGYRYTGAGSSPTSSVTGRVFLDADGDLAFDGGEQRDNATYGTRVNLIDEDGYVVATTTTDASGNYAFTGAFVGNYTVQAIEPLGTRYSAVFLSAGSPFTGLNVIYTLDTLEYLARGGRIGRVKAIAGALLHLKPVIRVDTDGKYSTVKTEPTINKSITVIVEHLREKYGTTPLWVTVLHGRFAEKAETLASEVKQKLNVAKLEVTRISPVLGVHTGPGIVGAAVVPMELMEGLRKT